MRPYVSVLVLWSMAVLAGARDGPPGLPCDGPDDMVVSVSDPSLTRNWQTALDLRLVPADAPQAYRPALVHYDGTRGEYVVQMISECLPNGVLADRVSRCFVQHAVTADRPACGDASFSLDREEER